MQNLLWNQFKVVFSADIFNFRMRCKSYRLPQPRNFLLFLLMFEFSLLAETTRKVTGWNNYIGIDGLNITSSAEGFGWIKGVEGWCLNFRKTPCSEDSLIFHSSLYLFKNINSIKATILRVFYSFCSPFNKRQASTHKEMNCLHEQRMCNEIVFTVGWFSCKCPSGDVMNGTFIFPVSWSLNVITM